MHASTSDDGSPDAVKPGHIFLVGLSGTGKTTAGRLLADELGLPFIDTDTEIERRTGQTIPELFESSGEPAFRDTERKVLAEIASGPSAVVSTGGGLPLDPANRDLMKSVGLIAWLDAHVDVLVDRLQRMESHGRPLLQDDPRTALTRLSRERRPIYAQLGHWIDVSGTPLDTVSRVMAIIDHGAITGEPTAATPVPDSVEIQREPIWVRAPSQTYPIYVGLGLFPQIGAIIKAHGLDTRLHVVVDERVDELHGDAFRAGLGEEVPFTWQSITAGEEQKTMKTVNAVYDNLLRQQPERQDVIVALGGGVIGDLVGYVAATLLRGIRFIQVPTTLLSQVDSSVGGKVGVDHERGKNLIGAFHQPNLVIADLDVLRTLPPREIAAGWAEVVKIAVVQDAALFEDLERSAELLNQLDPEATERAIRRDIELKATLIEQDERDTTGARAVLNYGHTVGHALEAATGYGTLLHGEAIAIGMNAAARIAGAGGLFPREAIVRQARLLQRLGLPSRCEVASPEAVKEAISLDKKRAGAKTTWILPTGIGSVRVISDVPDQVVDAAIRLVAGPAPARPAPAAVAPTLPQG